MSGSIEDTIQSLKDQGCRFPIHRYNLRVNYGVSGEAVVKELAQRGLLQCSEAYDGSLNLMTADMLATMGVEGRVDFRQKYEEGKIKLERNRQMIPHQIALVLRWAGLAMEDDGRREVKLRLSPETLDGLEKLRTRMNLPTRDAVVERLAADALKAETPVALPSLHGR